MTSKPTQPSILFVCLGNICRSPLAEGVCRHELMVRGAIGSVFVDSCGTGGWHVGQAPDPRSVEIAADHGVDISRQLARQLTTADYRNFDLLVAMDRDNYRTLVARRPANATAKLVRFMDLLGDEPTPDVPDPYYGGEDGFANAWVLLAGGMGTLIERVLTPTKDS